MKSDHAGSNRYPWLVGSAMTDPRPFPTGDQSAQTAPPLPLYTRSESDSQGLGAIQSSLKNELLTGFHPGPVEQGSPRLPGQQALLHSSLQECQSACPQLPMREVLDSSRLTPNAPLWSSPAPLDQSPHYKLSTRLTYTNHRTPAQSCTFMMSPPSCFLK